MINASDQDFHKDLLTLPIYKGFDDQYLWRHLEDAKERWINQPRTFIAEPSNHQEVEQVFALWCEYFPGKEFPKAPK